MDKRYMAIGTSMLVLKLLEEEPLYGYQMIRLMEQRSRNVFQLKEGTLYPILHIDETTSPASVYYTLEKVEAPDLATRVKWFEERDYYCPLPLSKSPGIVQNDGWN